GEIAVRDGLAARHLRLGALDVDMDPLVIAGGVGEGVDAVLGDLHPVGHADLLARKRGHGVEGRGLHGMSPVQFGSLASARTRDTRLCSGPSSTPSAARWFAVR